MCKYIITNYTCASIGLTDCNLIVICNYIPLVSSYRTKIYFMKLLSPF